MGRALRFSLLVGLTVSSLAAWPQNQSSPLESVGEVCVATVSNVSASAALVDRMTERLSKDLKENKVRAVTMDSSTTRDYKLHPTAANGDEAKSTECDYILLTQIVDPKAHPEEPHLPPISIGGKVPSVDASDPLGGSSGPVYRDNLQISFALFQVGRFEPVVDTVLVAQPSGNASDNFLSAMDKESNRIRHELKKKK